MKRGLVCVAIAVALFFGFSGFSAFSREQEVDRPDTAKLTQKLDQVLANQDEILRQIDQIKRELAIVKVRASRR